MISPIRSCAPGALALLLFATVPCVARADEPAPDRPPREAEDARRCEDAWSVFVPVPQRCLGAIETDRPSRTDIAHTVPAGHVQVEAGVVEYDFVRFSGPSDNQLTVGRNNYKLGLADRLGPINHWDLQVLHSIGSYAVRSRRFAGAPQLTVRTKLNVLEGPVSLTLAPILVTPVGKGATFEGGGYVFVNVDLPLGLGWASSVGAQTLTDPASASRYGTTVVSSMLARQLVGPVSVFGEVYGDVSRLEPSTLNASLDAGAVVALGRDWQLDAGAYFGVLGTLPRATPFVGLSYRL